MTAYHQMPTESAHTESTPVVETWNLRKVYRAGFWLNQKIPSLKDCTIRIDQGETFGLLGPNGAGKTTLLKTLLGIVRPTAGKGMLLGYPLGDHRVKHKIGYLPENAYYYDYLTGWELLQFAAGLFGIPQAVQKKRIPELLDLVGLAQSAAKKKQLRQYSKGMVQRVGMAQALINDPDVVFLDEPMSGLDPMGRYQVRQIVLSLKERGKTIFFNSHILSDVEQICDRIAILAQGDLICMGSLDELLGKVEVYHVTVNCSQPNLLEPWLTQITCEKNICHGQLKGDTQEFLANLPQLEAQLVSFNSARISLEEFFLQQLRDRGIYISH